MPQPYRTGQRVLSQQFDRPLPVIVADAHLPEKGAITQGCPFWVMPIAAMISVPVNESDAVARGESLIIVDLAK